ncbi:glycosyltransferase family 39 protein [Microcoleus sp. FACHB-1515]|uniref:glycosyltransferase family 39 protein n=1 Tax=Cyanophyceae TaxID=3028117 RepID=UPI0016829314|nr:glycosyltransferase family 39 protein [Microcoleus sp. FACHB-1515]MBD2091002.1 glycosyltransferase family 39 protein [Microcoleus sp. FACHB-1515]
MKRLSWALAIVILFGAILRLTNLDGKLYWHDEAYTSLRISGYTQAEVYQQIFTGEVLPIAALDRYQHPNSEKTWIDTFKTLAIDDPQHPPLYYVMVRGWVDLWGRSTSSIVRSFSALTSLLVLPAMYWLAHELFVQIEAGRQYLGSAKRSHADPKVRQTACWFTVALVAVSPYHLLYAQEAREYALWALLTAISSALLLRSLRLRSRSSWIAYSISLILGLYTYLLMILVAIGHGIYVLLRERRLSRSLIAFGSAIVLSVLAFAPWLWLVVSTWSSTGATWTATGSDRLILLKLWGLSLDRAFVLTPSDFGFDSATVYFSLPVVLLLSAIALYVVCRQTAFATWGFIVTLFAATFLPLALPDFLIGGQRSAASRYLVPCYLALQLAIAFLLARWSRHNWGRAIAALVLSVSAIACVQATFADTAWNKVISYNNRPLAAIISQEPRPLLVTSSFAVNFGNLFALSDLLDRDVHLQLIFDLTNSKSAPIPTIDRNFDSVFLLNLNEQQRQAIEQQRQTSSQQRFQDFHLSLWQLR